MIVIYIAHDANEYSLFMHQAKNELEGILSVHIYTVQTGLQEFNSLTEITSLRHLTPISSALSCRTLRGLDGCLTVKAGTPG